MTSSSLKARSRAILIDCYAFAVFASIIISVLNIVLFCLGDLASFSSRFFSESADFIDPVCCLHTAADRVLLSFPEHCANRPR